MSDEPKPLTDEDKKRIERIGRRLKIGGIELDLKNCAPLTMGDAKTLGASGVRVMFDQYNVTDTPENLTKYLSHFVRKLKPDITDEQIDALSSAKTAACVTYIQVASYETDDPN